MMICGSCGGNPTGALWVGMPRRARSLSSARRRRLTQSATATMTDATTPTTTPAISACVNVLAFDNGAASHAVFVPEASSPAALVVPAGHDTHAFADTYSFAAHNVASHVVSVPEASSFAALVVPAGHDYL